VQLGSRSPEGHVTEVQQTVLRLVYGGTPGERRDWKRERGIIKVPGSRNARELRHIGFLVLPLPPCCWYLEGNSAPRPAMPLSISGRSVRLN
jgi:hypothetical protein